MIHVFKNLGLEPDAQLPTHTSLGGYPLLYLTEDFAEICPDCVNSETEGFRTIDDPQWNIMFVHPYYEGPPLDCMHCDNMIHSAYGDPETGDPNNDNS